MSTSVSARELFYLYPTPHGDIAALRGLSIEIEQGQSVAVLGPSGAGKSTLLALCAGLRRASSGSLNLLGVEVEGAGNRTLADLRRRKIGIVRQHYHRALPAELTVEEIVTLPLRLLGRVRQPERDRARQLIDRAGLTKRTGAFPRELSGGEQQRLALCAALAKKPRLLLADEPTGELDLHASQAVVELMLDLCREEQTSALIVTHDVEVALRTDRTVQLRDGRLSGEGTERPVLLLDEQGWLRLPRRLREEAGLHDRVRARAQPGKLELTPADPNAAAADSQPSAAWLAVEKRYAEVAVARLRKRYGRGDSARTILDNLTHSFEPELFHVVAGPSGSGKTTLLNLIAGLEQADDGEVWVGGVRVDSLPAVESARFRQTSLGYLSQHSTLVEFLSVRENVELGLALRSHLPAQAGALAERALARVGLAGLADRRADRLSGGEQRRVALARALAATPRVLIADEPTANLDRASGRQIVHVLTQAAHEAGITVIAASHDPDVVVAADTCLEISHDPPPPSGMLVPLPEPTA